MSSIVLNMIVRNESKVIRRMLESCVDMIDSWVIVDTGSTDNTVEIIETFFKNAGKPGFIRYRPFDDFGSARTHALQLCPYLCPDKDWILLLDADMVLKTDSDFKDWFRQKVDEYDAFYLFQGDESFQTKNVRIIRNDPTIRYWGTTHEYVCIPDGKPICTIPTGVMCIIDIGDGGSKGDKGRRDIRLLLKGLETEPSNARYLFYLGNTYADMGLWSDAIETYEKRIICSDGWFEEVWYCYYRMGQAFLELGNKEKALESWLTCYEIMPERVENICQIVRLYREAGKNKLAHLFYQIGSSLLKRGHDGSTLIPDVLFVHSSMYRYWLDYELSIFGYYWNPTSMNLASVCMNLLTCKDFVESSGYLENLLSNYKWYAPSLKSLAKDNQSIQYPPVTEGWTFSTPSITVDDTGNKIILARCVNYRIRENGSYECKETIATRNFLKYGDKDWCEIEYDLKDLDNCYEGIEDMRIQWINGSLYFTGNRGLVDGSMRIQYGKIQYIDNDTTFKTESRLLTYSESKQCEKNWVLTGLQVGQMVYGWKPLIIGQVDEDRFVEEKRIEEVPAFFSMLRGSTNGVQIGDEVWFLCHLVSYDSKTLRHYYHIFVVLDKELTSVKRWSKLFTFSGEPIEYSCGFLQEGDDIRIGYSTWDRTTSFLTVPIDSIPF